MDTLAKHNDVRLELIADPTEPAAEDPVQFVRRKLRGRYRVTVLLAALFALCGALIGLSAAPVRYESGGFVQFKPALPTILYKSEENQPTPLFDSFVAAQATMMHSRQILEAALVDPAMSGLEWPQGAEGVAALEGAINVRHNRGDQVVTIAATHRDPRVAQAVVNAVINAFDRTYNDPIRLNPTVRERKLVQREDELAAQIKAFGEQILVVSDQYGADTIRRLHQEKIQELIAVDQKLGELTAARTALRTLGDAGPGAPVDAALGLETIAGLLPPNGAGALTALHEEEMAILAEQESYRGRLGDRHPRIRDLDRRLDEVRAHMAMRQRAFAEASPVGGGAHESPTAASLLRLDEIERQYQARRIELRHEATTLGDQVVALDHLEEQANTVKLRLGETRQALDVLRVESNREESARIVTSLGDLPTAPATDRRQPLAVAAALFGAGLAGCLVVGVGIFDPRVRFAAELQSIDAKAPVISLIPDISAACAEIDELAALGVHQLRNLMELQREQDQHGVYTITSAGRREGKTSLVLALGASFAMAGRRTLIVDADVSRAGLTHELGMIGLSGLCEAIGPVNRGGEIHQTDNDNLWALPVGTNRDFDPRDVSRGKLLSLVEAIRGRFDVIIFDTGPVLTGLEASLVSSISTRVIMTVACNQHSAQVRASLERLRRIGAECTGLVFNLAPPSDFDRRDWHVAQSPAHAAPLIPETPTPARNLVGTLGKSGAARRDAGVPLRNAA
jgi:Mrp family chromosome partitioning ATPase